MSDQLTRDEMLALDADGIAEAYRQGKLDELLGREPRPTQPLTYRQQVARRLGLLSDDSPPPSTEPEPMSFDGGARTTPSTAPDPNDAMNDWIREVRSNRRASTTTETGYLSDEP